MAPVPPLRTNSNVAGGSRRFFHEHRAIRPDRFRPLVTSGLDLRPGEEQRGLQFSVSDDAEGVEGGERPLQIEIVAEATRA
jgi:hypothetical protein